MDGIRLVEEAVLKTVGLKGLAGSIPAPSANNGESGTGEPA